MGLGWWRNRDGLRYTYLNHFWHFQVKIKFQIKVTRQGSIRLPDADFFWIIPWGTFFKVYFRFCIYHFLQTFVRYSHQIFYFLLFLLILDFTSASRIIFHKLLTSFKYLKKRFLSQIFLFYIQIHSTPPPPTPLP